MASQQNPGGRQKTPRNKPRGQGGFPADQRRFAGNIAQSEGKPSDALA